MQATATPPMSCRGAEIHSARLRPTHQTMTPIGRIHSGSSASSAISTAQRPENRAAASSGMSRMTRFAAPPAAGSSTAPAGAALRRTQNQHSRSSLQVASGRRLSPSESANSLRHGDGSSTAGEREQLQQGLAGGWSMAGSRSSPSLDMRMMSGRLASRDTPNATPRPQTSARVR